MKFDTYKRLLRQDEYGFIDSDHCDSLLFSGLVGCVQGVNVEIEMARDSSGLWHRRPLAWTMNRGCCGEGAARTVWQRLKDAWAVRWDKTKMQKEFERGSSTISRDMLVGLAWYCWFNRRGDIAEDVVRHALSNRLCMGVGTPTRTTITPALLATFALISAALGGPKRRWLTWVGTGRCFEGGFQAHLWVLHTLLRKKMGGKVSELQWDCLVFHAKRQPKNPLFRIAVNDKKGAAALLENRKWWPEGRLPTAGDRSEGWLTQRDYGQDWMQAFVNRDKIHHGGDYVFTYALLNDKLKV